MTKPDINLREEIEKLGDKHRRWVHGAKTRCLNVIDFDDEIVKLFIKILETVPCEESNEGCECTFCSYARKVKAWREKVKEEMR